MKDKRKKVIMKIEKSYVNELNNGMATKEKGITLIALIITIVVLLILAGVSIGALTGNKGILDKVVEARELYDKAEIKEEIEMVINDYNYAVKSSDNEDINFENYLRKNLEVGVQKNEDNTVSFLLNDYQVVIDTTGIISMETFEISIDKIYACIEDMQADTELTAGNLVQTESYYRGYYAGGAYYDIVETTSLKTDGKMCIQLDNGLYAELHPINDTITVNQFGAYGDGENDDAEAIQVALNAGYQNVVFESEQYKQNSQIVIQTSNVFIFGNNATIFNNSDDYVTQSGSDFHFYIKGKDSEWIDNICVYKLNIDSEKAGDLSEIQLGGRFISNCEISNCTLNINEDSESRNTGITNIWFIEDWKNITIEDNQIVNKAKTGAGGSVWFSNKTDKGTLQNVNINNNYIEEECYDEPVAFWGTIENIVFQNNTLKRDGTECGNTMTMRLGYSHGSISNIEISNNNFEILGYRSFIMFGSSDVENVSNIIVENNTINYTIISNSYEFTLCTVSDPKEYSNLVVQNNSIEINSNIESASVNTLVSNDIEFCNNNVNIDNCDVRYFSVRGGNFSNNNISLNGNLKSGFFYYTNNLLKNINIQNNVFSIYDNEETWGENKRYFLCLQSMSFSNYNFYIKNNILNIDSTQINKQLLVNFNTILDETPNTIIMSNNSFGIFENIRNYNNSVEHQVEFQ